MADDRRHTRSPPQINEPPEKTQQAGRDPGVDALQIKMTGAERDARDDESHRPAAEPHVEPMQQERALDFLAHAAGDEDHEGEQPRVARRAEETLQWVL